MIRFFKNLFKAKDPGPAPDAPYKVETPVQVAQVSVVEEVNVAPAEKPAKKAPAKKRTFKKREEGGTAKVAKIKPPAKSKTPRAK